VAFCWDVAWSYSDREMTPALTSSFVRPKVRRASSLCASSEASWARSCRVSSSDENIPFAHSLAGVEVDSCDGAWKVSADHNAVDSFHRSDSGHTHRHCPVAPQRLVTASEAAEREACTADSICSEFDEAQGREEH